MMIQPATVTRNEVIQLMSLYILMPAKLSICKFIADCFSGSHSRLADFNLMKASTGIATTFFSGDNPLPGNLRTGLRLYFAAMSIVTGSLVMDSFPSSHFANYALHDWVSPKRMGTREKPGPSRLKPEHYLIFVFFVATTSHTQTSHGVPRDAFINSSAFNTKTRIKTTPKLTTILGDNEQGQMKEVVTLASDQSRKTLEKDFQRIDTP
ncbi:hypothetical protein FPQ18DRAFT_309526 [Pyronema domesticum]|nr:hypothetical protein FPQ18DRAFT_309526 [Pyronema domesticum]